MDPRLYRTAKRLAAFSPSLCLAKWAQATLHLHNGHTQSCHHVRSHRIPLTEIEKDPTHLHNTLRKRRTRQSMQEGLRPRECQYCWNVETAGQISDRIFKSAEPWAEPFFEHIENPNPIPRYLEVAFDNICNFKCMYCSPIQSSAWAQEIKEYGSYPTSTRYNSALIRRLQGTQKLSKEIHQKYIDAFWQWWPQLRSQLMELRLTGGEPLLTSSTWRLLQELGDTPPRQLAFSLNSNLGVPRSLLDRLLVFIRALEGRIQSFTLYCSVDSVGAQAEYIRHGLSFQQLSENTERLLTESPSGFFRLSYMITINALSLPGLSALFKQIAQQRRRYPRHIISVDTPYLRNPEHQSVFVLPESFQRYLEDAIHTLRSEAFSSVEIQRLERVLHLMKSHRFQGIKNLRMRYDFRRMFTEHDRRRGTDFLKTFPEYEEFYLSCP